MKRPYNYSEFPSNQWEHPSNHQTMFDELPSSHHLELPDNHQTMP